jgi:hypothetical protein
LRKTGEKPKKETIKNPVSRKGNWVLLFEYNPLLFLGGLFLGFLNRLLHWATVATALFHVSPHAG